MPSATGATNGSIQISRAALSHNYHTAKQLAGSCEVIVVVKSNGYGVGAEPIAQHLSLEGARTWAVSSISEAIQLRRAGIEGDIILLGHLEADDSWFELVQQHDCRPSVSCLDDALAVRDWTSRFNRALRVHLQVEIGMKRLGVPPAKVDEVISVLDGHPHLHIEAVYGHPPSSQWEGLDSEHRCFLNALQKTKQLCPSVDSHFASSTALAHGIGLYPHRYVRLGISLLGGAPSLAEVGNSRPKGAFNSTSTAHSQMNGRGDWKSVVSMVTKVVQIHRLRPGEAVSYDGDFCAGRATVVAVVPVGYADGIPTCLSNRLLVNVRNLPVRQIGRITMNYMMLDVTDLEGLQVGEVVTIGDCFQRFRDLAALSGHLPHELLARLSPWAPRVLV